MPILISVKIAYWETFDGSQIRELEGSKSGSIEGLDISSDGAYLVTGGADKLIKVTDCPSHACAWLLSLYQKNETILTGPLETTFQKR